MLNAQPTRFFPVVCNAGWEVCVTCRVQCRKLDLQDFSLKCAIAGWGPLMWTIQIVLNYNDIIFLYVQFDFLFKPAAPALLFLLIVVCPYRMEFWADSWRWYVGLLFCPLQARTWQKWFSTQSWLTIAGLIGAWGNFFNLIETIDKKPRIMDCKSKNNLFEKNFLADSSPASCYHSCKNIRNLCRS